MELDRSLRGGECGGDLPGGPSVRNEGHYRALTRGKAFITPTHFESFRMLLGRRLAVLEGWLVLGD